MSKFYYKNMEFLTERVQEPGIAKYILDYKASLEKVDLRDKKIKNEIFTQLELIKKRDSYDPENDLFYRKTFFYKKRFVNLISRHISNKVEDICIRQKCEFSSINIRGLNLNDGKYYYRASVSMKGRNRCIFLVTLRLKIEENGRVKFF